MTDFAADIELVPVRDPGTGEEFDTIRVPSGFCLVLVPDETAEGFREWRECAAVRIVASEDGKVGTLQIAPDLDWLTGPEAGE